MKKKIKQKARKGKINFRNTSKGRSKEREAEGKDEE